MVISRAMSNAERAPGRALPPAVVIASCLLLLLPVSCGSSRRAVERAMTLYNQGKYAEALPLLQEVAGGRKDGRITYQIGYCREIVEGNADARRAAWKEAEPLLEAEVAHEKGATLERLYYLTSINNDQGEFDRVRQYARQAIEQYEKGMEARTLTGEDWFRLGRMHDFLSEVSEAEGAYRRAVSAFDRVPAQNPAYHSLALVRVGDLDFDGGRLPEAADAYDRALALLPDTKQIRPFEHAVALLAAGRYEEAARRFGEDRDESTMIESQYAADLARKAKQVEPLDEADADGTRVQGLPPDLLGERVKAAGAAFRAAREKYEVRPGEALPSEVAAQQRRFVSLLRELMVSRRAMQDFCLKNNVADLVRR